MVKRQLQTRKSGERTDSAGRAISNRILLSVSDPEFRRIRPRLEFLNLPSHFKLHEPQTRLRFLYFLNSGLASLVVASDNRAVEAGVVGFEGAVGTALAVGLRTSSLGAVVQIAGAAFRIPAAAFRSVASGLPGFQRSLGRYAVLQAMQVAQTAACNRLHDVVQRLARWLLMAQDRVDSGVLEMTHDFLALMLGTDRPSVSIAAGALQCRNAIRYSRGSVHILNRKRLESAACECYRRIQQWNGDLGLK